MSTGEEERPAAVLCVGTERWLKIQAVERLKGRELAAGFEETDFVRFPDPPEESEGILEALRTSPFGPGRRLVWLDGLEEAGSASLPWLPDYLAQPNPKACLILCADRLSREGSFLSQEHQRSGRLEMVWCRPLEGKALEDWIWEQGRRAGKEFEPKAVSLLAARLGSSLQAQALAVESLSLLVGSAGRIGAADVEALIPPSLRETAFEILDAAAAGKQGQALDALRQAMALGRLTADQFLGALGWSYRMAWKSRRGSRIPLAGTLEGLLRADVHFKQGHPSPGLLAEQLLIQYCVILRAKPEESGFKTRSFALRQAQGSG